MNTDLPCDPLEFTPFKDSHTRDDPLDLACYQDATKQGVLNIEGVLRDDFPRIPIFIETGDLRETLTASTTYPTGLAEIGMCSMNSWGQAGVLTAVISVKGCLDSAGKFVWGKRSAEDRNASWWYVYVCQDDHGGYVTDGKPVPADDDGFEIQVEKTSLPLWDAMLMREAGIPMEAINAARADLTIDEISSSTPYRYRGYERRREACAHRGFCGEWEVEKPVTKEYVKQMPLWTCYRTPFASPTTLVAKGPMA